MIITLLVFIITNTHHLAIVSAKKHVFHTKRDGRFLIAPIGEPFGFTEKGTCSLTVYDFTLTEKRSMTKKDKKKKRGGFFSSGKSSVDDDGYKMLPVDDVERSFEGGFVLKRFKTASAFVRFEEQIIEDPSICIYDQFRKNRRLVNIDDDDNDEDDFFNADIDDDYEYNNDDDDDATSNGSTNYYDDDFLNADIDDDMNGFGFIQNKKSSLVDAGEDGIFLSMRDVDLWGKHEGDEGSPAIVHEFTKDQEGLYFLIYQVCATSKTALFTEVRSSFKVDLQLHNVDQFGNISYLTAGEVHLPFLFFFFSISYGVLIYIWNLALKGENFVKAERVKPKGKMTVRAVHHLMAAVVFLKAFSMIFEAIRYHFIAVHGHAELWSFVYYSITFLKGILLFSVILLIGSGWSLVKPFLHDREKKIVFFVLFLQVIDNIAVVMLLSETEGERRFENWRAILHIVDIICCCAILLPIIWQVSVLENDVENTENARTVEKLKLFRSFYLLVMAYIYYTRVIVYLVESTLPFKYTWMSTFMTEIGTIAFFVITGYYFRPTEETISLELTNNEGINREDAEYGEVEPLCAEDIIAIVPTKKNID